MNLRTEGAPEEAEGREEEGRLRKFTIYIWNSKEKCKNKEKYQFLLVWSQSSLEQQVESQGRGDACMFWTISPQQ